MVQLTFLKIKKVYIILNFRQMSFIHINQVYTMLAAIACNLILLLARSQIFNELGTLVILILSQINLLIILQILNLVFSIADEFLTNFHNCIVYSSGKYVQRKFFQIHTALLEIFQLTHMA